MNRKVRILDNTGVLEGKVISVLNKRKDIKVGSLIVLRVTKNIPYSKIRKGAVERGVIVTSDTIEGIKGVVLVKLKKTEYIPIGTRIRGLLSSDLKKVMGCEKILALVKKTI